MCVFYFITKNYLRNMDIYIYFNIYVQYLKNSVTFLYIQHFQQKLKILFLIIKTIYDILSLCIGKQFSSYIFFNYYKHFIKIYIDYISFIKTLITQFNR